MRQTLKELVLERYRLRKYYAGRKMTKYTEEAGFHNKTMDDSIYALIVKLKEKKSEPAVYTSNKNIDELETLLNVLSTGSPFCRKHYNEPFLTMRKIKDANL